MNKFGDCVVLFNVLRAKRDDSMKLRTLPLLAIAGLLAAALPSCINVKTEHEVKPIEINVNVRVQVEKELDNFFDDLDNEKADLAS